VREETPKQRLAVSEVSKKWKNMDKTQEIISGTGLAIITIE
jgi:hypothetical protein